jgi:hypothetical protein
MAVREVFGTELQIASKYAGYQFIQSHCIH